MPSSETLDGFAAAVTRPGTPVPGGLTSPSGRLERRFAVYRNNIAVSLIEAIGARHPVTRRLMGEADFRPAARAFVLAVKPETPVMLAYGTGFADFLARSPEMAGRDDLVGLARLESAWIEAYHAAEAEPVGIDRLAAVPGERLGEVGLRLHPSARLVRAPAGTAATWSAETSGGGAGPGDPREGVDGRSGETILVVRPDADVTVTVLPSADVPFAAAVAAGLALGEAAAGCTDPDFDFGRALVGLFSLGAVAGLILDGEILP